MSRLVYWVYAPVSLTVTIDFFSDRPLFFLFFILLSFTFTHID